MSSKKKSNSKTQIDFATIDAKDVHNIDYSDPVVLDQLGMEPLPEFDKKDKKYYDKIREAFMKTAVKMAILESQRQELFDMIKSYDEKNGKTNNEDSDASSDDESEKKSKEKKKKKKESKSDEESDDDSSKKSKKKSKKSKKEKSESEDDNDSDEEEESEEEPPKKSSKNKKSSSRKH